MLLALGLPVENLRDLLQDALLLWLRKRAHVVYFDAWICGVVRSYALRGMRRQRRFVRLADLAEADSRFDGDPDGSARLELNEALSLLDQRAATAIRLRWLEGSSVPDVASAIGVTPSNAKKILHRSLATLKRLLRTRPL